MYPSRNMYFNLDGCPPWWNNCPLMSPEQSNWSEKVIAFDNVVKNVWYRKKSISTASEIVKTTTNSCNLTKHWDNLDSNYKSPKRLLNQYKKIHITWLLLAYLHYISVATMSREANTKSHLVAQLLFDCSLDGLYIFECNRNSWHFSI